MGKARIHPLLAAPAALVCLMAAVATFLTASSALLMQGLDLWGRLGPATDGPLAGFPPWTWAWPRYAWALIGGELGMTADRAMKWLLIAGAAGVVPALAFGTTGRAILRRGRPEMPAIYGRTRWATPKEAARTGITISKRPAGEGIIIGQIGGSLSRRYLTLRGTEHVGLYAGTGSGKGVSFAVPNCMWWEGSLVAFDVKGELYRKTAARRRGMGQQAFYFAPTDPNGRTHRWNPYSALPRDRAAAMDMIYRINHVLIPPNPNSHEPYFDNTARAIINALAVILHETPGAKLSVPAIRRMVLRPDYREAIRKLIDDGHRAGRPYPQSATDELLSWVGMADDKGRESIQRTVASHLGLWGSPAIASAMEASDFDLRDLRSVPTSIYLGVRATETERLRPITTLFFQLLLELHTEVEFRKDPTHRCEVLMMLDEFAALGRMPILASAADYVRSYGLRLAYVLQSRDQLAINYGDKGAEKLSENTGVEIYFGVRGIKTAEYVSKMAGNDTVKAKSESRPKVGAWANPDRQTESEAERGRPFVLPQEVQRLDPEKQIIFRKGMQAMRTERVIYHRDPLFRGLEQPAPQPPPLTVTVARDDGARPT